MVQARAFLATLGRELLRLPTRHHAPLVLGGDFNAGKETPRGMDGLYELLVGRRKVQAYGCSVLPDPDPNSNPTPNPNPNPNPALAPTLPLALTLTRPRPTTQRTTGQKMRVSCAGRRSRPHRCAPRATLQHYMRAVCAPAATRRPTWVPPLLQVRLARDLWREPPEAERLSTGLQRGSTAIQYAQQSEPGQGLRVRA